MNGNRIKPELIYVEFETLRHYSSKETVKRYSNLETELWPQEREAIEKYFIKDGGYVLDIGCGTGRTTYPLYKLGFDVLGIDISEPMIEEAMTKFPDIDFEVGDACKLRFENETFDYVLFSFNGIDHIYPEQNRLKALREIHRILKPNGVFIFSSHNSWKLLPDPPLHSSYHRLPLFIIHKIVNKSFSSKYKPTGPMMYSINPFKQKRELENCGFKLLDMIGTFRWLKKYFERWPYYIAQKEEYKKLKE